MSRCVTAFQSGQQSETPISKKRKERERKRRKEGGRKQEQKEREKEERKEGNKRKERKKDPVAMEEMRFDFI